MKNNLNKNKKVKVATPDFKFKNSTVGRMINSLMYDGKKSIAEKIVYSAIDKVMKDEIGSSFESPQDMIKKLILKAKPQVEVFSRRIKGATFPVPTEVNPRRAEMLALRWIRQGARDRGMKMDNALSEEITSVLHDKACYTLKRREEVHKMAKANLAFSQFKGSR